MTRKLENSKTSKGFTLIELLIVTVVIVTMMGIMFRLAGMGGGSRARATTIKRMQALEFALSGYYAAFGSYPPVPLHGVRDVYRKTNAYGIQYMDEDQTITSLDDDNAWRYVKAACRSQPVAVEFPYNKQTLKPSGSDSVFSTDYSYLGQGDNNNFEGRADEASWQYVRTFKFGVLSYLLPRYLFMMEGFSELYTGGAQWKSQNRLSSLYRIKDGTQLYSSWQDLQKRVKVGTYVDADDDYNSSDFRALANQPSQIVCTRWLSALAGNVRGGENRDAIEAAYGVNLSDGDDYTHNRNNTYTEDESGSTGEAALREKMAIYSLSGKDRGNNNEVFLDGMTVVDGWEQDLYYYSPPPYQSYRLWSAGPNRKTFPPWIDMKEFRSAHSKDADTAADWMADDIVQMSVQAGSSN